MKIKADDLTVVALANHLGSEGDGEEEMEFKSKWKQKLDSKREKKKTENFSFFFYIIILMKNWSDRSAGRLKESIWKNKRKREMKKEIDKNVLRKCEKFILVQKHHFVFRCFFDFVFALSLVSLNFSNKSKHRFTFYMFLCVCTFHLDERDFHCWLTDCNVDWSKSSI